MTKSLTPYRIAYSTLIGFIALASITACNTTPVMPMEQVETIAQTDDYYFELEADLESGDITQAEFDAQVRELAEWKAGAK